jgi:DNA-binding GntR family transcriptional regulator
MINPSGGRSDPGSPRLHAVPADVLADRIAAALILHEPGWRLPRLTALARRYHVSTTEVDAALEELAARHLLRRLPDGQIYRASPAEYRLPLEGLAGLSSQVDPMGGELTCRSRQVSTRRVPEDTGRVLGLDPAEDALVIRCLWHVGGEPAAMTATYLPQRLASLAGDVAVSPLPTPGDPSAAPGSGGPDDLAGHRDQVPQQAGQPGAVQVELSPPAPYVARTLRLPAGRPVAVVTVRFDDPATGTPVALTIAMLRPELFRIVVQAPAGGLPAVGEAGFASVWPPGGEN